PSPAWRFPKTGRARLAPKRWFSTHYTKEVLMLSRAVRHWWHRIVEAMRRKNRRAMRSRPSSVRPSLEVLEMRALPSINPIIGDVFVIDMENHNLTQPASVTSPQQLLGNPAAAYLNSLMTPGDPNAAQTSFATNYYNAAFNDTTINNGKGIH